MTNLKLAKILIQSKTSFENLKTILAKYICEHTLINDEEWKMIKSNKMILEMHNYNTDDLQLSIDATNIQIEELLLTPNKIN